MSRRSTVYACEACGHQESRWFGRCPACGGWNTAAEDVPVARTTGVASAAWLATSGDPIPISDVKADSAPRFTAGSDELDRVLGGGVLPGSLTLIGGDPGIGKSTMVLQSGLRVASAGRRVLYVSGEESTHQLRLRADRLGAPHEDLLVVSETNLELIEQHVLRVKPDLLVIDSIQTVYTPEVASAAGSVGQVREGAAHLLRLGKSLGCAVFIVGHVTKDGTLAGPRVLEHIVDTVLYFEGERHAQFRVLRAVKNRFGGTNEVGLFEMGDSGLVDVPDASRMFLSERPSLVAGSVVVPTVGGTRPLLVEVQALVSGSHFVPPRRTADGVDLRQVQLLAAVLDKRIGMPLGSCDVYVKVAGGISVEEPAVDLALTLALASSFRDRPLRERTAVFGEVGLGGEVRPVAHVEQRLREAKKLGFVRIVLPGENEKNAPAHGDIELIGVERVGEALQAALA